MNITRSTEAPQALVQAHSNYTTMADYAAQVGVTMIGPWNPKKGQVDIYLHASRMVRDMVGECPNANNVEVYLLGWKRICQLQRLSRQS